MKKTVILLIVIVLILIGILYFYFKSYNKEPDYEYVYSGDTEIEYPKSPAQYNFVMNSSETRSVYYYETKYERPHYIVFDYDENDMVIGSYHYYYFDSDEEAGAVFNANEEKWIDPTEYRQIRCVDNCIVFDIVPESYWGMTKADVERIYSNLELIKNW